jgi:hypothetical protein
LALYATCVWVLLRRKRQGYIWHISTATTLFFFETLNLGLEAAVYIDLYLESVQLGKGQIQAGAMRSESMNSIDLLTNICSAVCL